MGRFFVTPDSNVGSQAYHSGQPLASKNNRDRSLLLCIMRSAFFTAIAPMIAPTTIVAVAMNERVVPSFTLIFVISFAVAQFPVA